MRKIFFAVLMIFAFTCSTLFAQLSKFELKIDTKNSEFTHLKPFKLSSKADAPTYFYLAAIINPMLVIEDKKVFFGLTKEISFGKFPYGRIAFEYSYIFRSYNTSHLRLSYNFDFVFDGGDFVVFIATPGAGYFTDTKNEGWFLHASVGAIMATSDHFGISPYLRYRHTFIKDKLKSDINDISLGVSFMFYY
ncbi:MAG: hypothetical protein ABI543_11935 [Ignavibacteria bacterium]